MTPTPSQQAASAAAHPNTTPLERVARAIADNIAPELHDQIAFGYCAQAALQALREVDEGTVEAMATALQNAFECRFCGGDVPDCGCGHESWQEGSSFKKVRASHTAAINHILGERR